VVAEINGGKPEADARDGIETEAPLLVPAVEEEHIGRDSAVEARENVNAIAAETDHGSIPLGEVPAVHRNVKFVGHGEIGAGSGNEGITEETEAVDGEEAEIKALEERESLEKIPKHREGEIGDEKHVTEAEGLGEKGPDLWFEAEAEVLADDESVDVAERGI